MQKSNGGKNKRYPQPKAPAKTPANTADILRRAIKLEHARTSFWEYEKLRNPRFFKDSRPHLTKIANTLQNVYEKKMLRPDGKPYRKVIIDLPPRHGKSYSMSNFCQWVLGKNNEERIGDISYNENLSNRFSRGVRDAIDETKIDDKRFIFRDVFPETRTKYGDASVGVWSLEDQFFNFLATSFGGTLTGVGFTLGIIDDPIKSHTEAFNDDFLENQYQWYTDTFLSRMEEGGMTVIIMTRWATKDLAGRVQEDEPDEWLVLSMPAYDEETDSMLCPELLSRETYEFRKQRTSPEIFGANYQQVPVDSKDRLYTLLRTYRFDELKRDAKGQIAWDVIAAYADTADEGEDFLCLLIAGVIDGIAYVLDVLYTDRPMEYTEPETARRIYDNKTNSVKIESNNGGRGFARSVKRIVWETYQTRKIHFEWFTQSQNKRARIMSNATFVMDNILYPEDWKERWPEYYRAMTTYKRKGKNEHDDAPDATTGFAEWMIEGIKRKLLFGYRTLD